MSVDKRVPLTVLILRASNPHKVKNTFLTNVYAQKNQKGQFLLLLTLKKKIFDYFRENFYI